uniref:Uncharacterized protein n=1 Tax=viral metagenome TaxID=1070528 RepID=A0A6C0LTZ4_9ZZZZ
MITSVITKCISIKSPIEAYLQCTLGCAPGEKYCSIHLNKTLKIDYRQTQEDTISIHDDFLIKEIHNPIIGYFPFNSTEKNKINIKKISTTEQNHAFKEESVEYILNSYYENEDDLIVKLLILVNDEEYHEEIPHLIGPVYNDITVSEDDKDPVTMDIFWKIQDGKKVVESTNKYFIFSFQDSKKKIRCLSIFTLHIMVKNNDFTHPITLEMMSNDDIERAKKLIKLYDSKLGLFSIEESFSPGLRLKQKITELFQKFHIHNIYFDVKWLLDLQVITKLNKIIIETHQLIVLNLKSINPTLKENKLFIKKETNKIIDILKLKEYIVEEWYKLIEMSNSPNNQIPIWIIAKGLSFVVPEIKRKYPDLI